MTMKATKPKVSRLLACSAFVFALISCASQTIGLNTDFQGANFQVNKTTKQEVVDRLGLPQKIMKDSAGREHYIYAGATRLVGACIGCADTSSVGLIPALINDSEVKDGAEYVFNSANLLVAKFEAKKE